MFRKILSFFSALIILLSLEAPNAFAFIYPAPDPPFYKTTPVRAMNAVLWDLKVDKDELKYGIRDMNVSRRKKYPPLVNLDFQPANPTSGEKATAIATPQYFMNDIPDLYFTWFLKNEYCTDTNDSDYEYNKKCDQNNDGRVNIEDYKIKAMRVLASNDFEWDRKDENGKTVYERTTTNDNDGYKSIFGGGDQMGKSNHCYVHDTASGDEYEIKCEHLFPNAPDATTGDESFGSSEEQFWRTDPADPDTADTGAGDEANVAGRGLYTFSWNYEQGDQLGVVVEGVSIEATQEYDSSYRIMWAMPNKCEAKSSGTDDDENDPDKDDVEVTETFDKDAGVYIRTTVTTKRTSMGDRILVTETTLVEYLDQNTKAVISSEEPKVEYYFLDSDQNSIYEGATTPGINGPSTASSSFDLNDCLYDSLIDPLEGGGRAKKMEISLSYLPEFPVNDPSNDSADELVVHSTITNTDTRGFLKYSWQVFPSEEINPDGWGDPIPKEYLPEVKQTVGLNLDTFRFKLNFKEDFFEYLENRGIQSDTQIYFKVKLNITENVSSGVYKEGHSEIIIPISLTNQKIQVYNVAVSDDIENPTFSLKEDKSNERCLSVDHNGDKKTAPVCPIAKHEIIGMKLEQDDLEDYEFLWMVNGKPLEPIYYSGTEQCLSGECDPETGDATNIAFFPVLENKGKQYNVTLTVTDLKKDGKKTILTKTFEVVDPEIKILPFDETICQPKLIGNYVDLDGFSWPEYSKENFLCLTGYDLAFYPTFIAFIPQKYAWYVDENLITKDNAAIFGYNIDDAGILAVPSKPADAYYNIVVSALYSQDINAKRALNKYWGVSYSDFYEKQVLGKIENKIVKFFPENFNHNNETAKKTEQKILANIWSSTPAYLLFLLRIVLTIGIMLFISGLAFSISSKNSQARN